MISRDLIDEITAKADIVDVISSYLDVKKKGRNYVAICPFHNDTNPSLSISKDKQIFKCFVCGTSGNAISFVQKYEKISYVEAIKKVADIIGFHDERLNSEVYKPKKVDENTSKLIKTINDLQQFYKYSLSIEEASKANEYLAARNIDADQIAKYGIGYSPRDGEKTIAFLEAKGHSLKSIEDIGICYVNATKNSDSNAGRITFPLFDENGQVVGFSARQLEKDGSEKYRNSPETALFHKSRILYNYNNVKNIARHHGYCYLLEGFMDVMALDKAGIPSAVALMGTALTQEHIEMLRKLRVEIRLCLDGDNAGLRGMMKIISQFEKEKIPFRIVNYGEDLRDPDDILQQDGPEALVKKMNTLFDALPFQINYYQKHYKVETLEERKALLNRFLPKLVNLGPGIEQEDYIYKLADATSFHENAIREMIRKQTPVEKLDIAKYDTSSIKEKLASNNRYLTRLLTAEKTLLYYMLFQKEAVDFFENNVQNFYDPSYGAIANYIVDYYKTHGSINVSDLINEIDYYDDEDKDKLTGIVTELATNENFSPYKKEILDDCSKVITVERAKVNFRLKQNKLSGKELLEFSNLQKEELKKIGR